MSVVRFFAAAMLALSATVAFAQAQKAPAVRHLHVDQLVPHAGYHRLDHVFEAQTKNGPKPISDIHAIKALRF